MRYIIRGQIYLFPSPVPGIGLSASQLPRITQNRSYTRKLPGTGNKEPLLRLRSCQCNKFRRNYAQALSHNLWPHARISAWVYLGDRTILYTRIYLSNQFSLRFKIPWCYHYFFCRVLCTVKCARPESKRRWWIPRGRDATTESHNLRLIYSISSRVCVCREYLFLVFCLNVL